MKCGWGCGTWRSVPGGCYRQETSVGLRHLQIGIRPTKQSNGRVARLKGTAKVCYSNRITAAFRSPTVVANVFPLMVGWLDSCQSSTAR
jgi:hypothetical protein